MDIPYFIKRQFWMSDSAEVTLKKILMKVNPQLKVNLENKMVPTLWLL